MKCTGWVLALVTSFTAHVQAQRPESTSSLLMQFDAEHDLAAKEHLLRTITERYPKSAPALLRLAESTKNTDTRWMAMRGMATLRCTACASFLEGALKDSEPLVRANAARALGDLRIADASTLLLSMFAAEQDPAAIQQASLALRMLDIKASAPYVREKIPLFTGQTRSWLLQALGTVGDRADVPLVATHLDDNTSEMAAVLALQDLTGVVFGPARLNGLFPYPPPELLAARAWWKAHQAEWPRCDDCSHK